MEREGERFITTALLVRWNDKHPAAHATIETRTIAVRGFAEWLKALDSRHHVPPPYRGGLGRDRPKPYIFSDAEIDKLVACSGKLRSNKGIRPLTYQVLWRFLHLTGLRINEALALTASCFDFENGVVRIAPQKGRYERLVPLHPTTVKAVRRYFHQRNTLLGKPCDWLFTDEDGKRLKSWAAEHVFAAIGKEVGIRKVVPFVRIGKGPRIQDLRHTFAVNTLIQWYREGKDVDGHILILVDVMGHTSIRQTYWYIEAVPELQQLVTRKFERYMAGRCGPE